MICQECKERPATLHFTKINNGQKVELHLCEKCAQDKGEVFMLHSSSPFSINNLLAGLFNNMESALQSAQNSSFYQNNIPYQCPNCGLQYQQFIEVGRFGCAECYETFKEQLEPIFRRLHSGNSTHNGKIPKRMGGKIHLHKKLEQLRANLQVLISREEFEQAAIVRDEIRSIEKQLSESNGEGGI